MTTSFSQADIDHHLALRLARWPAVDDAMLSRISERYLSEVAGAPLLHDALDQLTAPSSGVWTVIWGEYGPGRYPLTPALFEVSCRCSQCRSFILCDRQRTQRPIRKYRTRVAAQSVATRFGSQDGAWYEPVNLPRAVLDTTSALLADVTCLQSDAFRAAALLST